MIEFLPFNDELNRLALAVKGGTAPAAVVMLVSVAERTREVGLLKALGVTRNQIVGVFLLEATLISTAGGLLGLAAGYGGGRLLMHFYPSFPVQPPVWAVLAALVV